MIDLPAPSTAPLPPKKLFDEASGLIDPKIYTNPDIYERELKYVFGRSWLFVAHESQFKKPGDFITTYMAEDPVIVNRQKDGTFAVLLNQCRHRGMRICRVDGGNAKSFTCPYHGWAYDMTGKLRSVPFESLAYGEIDKDKWSARRVPRVESYKGLIFATWSTDLPSLEEYLGPMAFYLDAAIDRSAAGMEVYGGVYKWVVPANWKLAAEQSCSDMYHGPTTHASVIMAAMGANTGATAPPLDAAGSQFRSESSGHGSGFYSDDVIGRGNFYVAMAGERVAGFDGSEGLPQATERLGAARAGLVLQHSVVFPNFAFFDGGSTLRVWHPRGPGEFEFWSMAVVPCDASPELKEQLRLGHIRGLGPAGTLEQDDGENWVEIQRVLRGYEARQTLFNAQMGLGKSSTDHETFPGRISYVYSEEAARGFYARWRELVLTEDLSPNGAGSGA